MSDLNELRRLIFTCIRYWWLWGAAALLMAAIGYFVSQLQTPVYAATSSLAVDQVIEAAQLTPADLQVITQLMRTNADLALRQPILEKVSTVLGLNEPWTVLRGRVRATPDEASKVLEVTAEAGTAEEARDIANEVAQQLILFNPVNLQKQNQKSNRRFIEERLAMLKTQIEHGQTQLNALKLIEPKNLPVPTSSVTSSGVLSPNLASTQEALDKQQTQLLAEIQNLEFLMIEWEKSYNRWLNILVADTGTKFLAVIDTAQTPSRPIRPQPFFYAGLFGLIGLGMGALFSLLLDYLTGALRPTDDLLQLLGLPLLGMVRRMTNSGRISRSATRPDTLAQFADDLRLVQNNLEIKCPKTPRVILVTSPNSGEGRSTIVANLGVLMAQSGFSTLIVDADRRQPTQHEIFRLSNDAGFMQLLHEAPLDAEDLNLWNVGQLPDLRVMTNGTPGVYGHKEKIALFLELLPAKYLSHWLSHLRIQADVVLIDSPPVLAAPDATLLAQFVDGVLLVVESNRTKRKAAQQARHQLQQANAKLFGVVMNQVAPNAIRRTMSNFAGLPKLLTATSIARSPTEAGVGNLEEMPRSGLAKPHDSNQTDTTRAPASRLDIHLDNVTPQSMGHTNVANLSLKRR